MIIRPKGQRLWWVYVDQKVHGPFTLEQIGKLPGITEKTRLCPEHSQEWTTLGELAATLETQAAMPEPGRRCNNCSRRARPGARYCEHCGTLVSDLPGAAGLPAAPRPKRSIVGRLVAFTALAAMGAAFAYGWRETQKRREALRPTGKVKIEVQQIVHTKRLRDVRGEERSPLPGKRFCLVTLLVRDPDTHPALFSRKNLRWKGPDGKFIDLDGLTPFLPSELLDTPRLEPGAWIQGRVVFQVPDGKERFKLLYGSAEIAVPPAVLEAERKWRGREEEAVRALKSFRCRGSDGRPRSWDPNIDMEPRQELGSLYHVDAEDYAFHVDLANGRVSSAGDAETLVSENTRRDCFGAR